MIKEVDFKNKSELAAAVEEIKRDKEHLIENAKIVAEIKYKYYDALRKQGFDKDQALEICMESATL